MADIEKLIPFIIKWETGIVKKDKETMTALFERARFKGWANSALDKGGATQTGLTIAAYRAWCKKHGKPYPTIPDLRSIPYATWKSIMKEDYWDRWKADQIESQMVANILVDWVWASGSWGIKKPQEYLKVTVDGIVGMKTITALNNIVSKKSELKVYDEIKAMRINFINNIVKSNPSQKVWLKGWTNRINDIPKR